MNWMGVIIAIFFLFGCSGEPLVGEADVAAAISTDVGAATLTVKTQHSGAYLMSGEYPNYILAEGSKSFQTTDGTTIWLTAAKLHWGSFNLISDGDDSDCTPGSDINIVLDYNEDILLADTQELELFSSQVPVLTYCRYEMVLASADNSVFLEGYWQNPDGDGEFSIGIKDDITIAGSFMVLEDGMATAHPLHFHDGETTATVNFTSYYDLWFDNVNFQSSTEEITSTVSKNIKQAFFQLLISGTVAETATHSDDHTH